MVLKQCPKCGVNAIKIYTKSGFNVSFEIKSSNQNIICPNCKRKISFSVYSVNKSKK